MPRVPSRLPAGKWPCSAEAARRLERAFQEHDQALWYRRVDHLIKRIEAEIRGYDGESLTAWERGLEVADGGEVEALRALWHEATERRDAGRLSPFWSARSRAAVREELEERRRELADFEDEEDEPW